MLVIVGTVLVLGVVVFRLVRAQIGMGVIVVVAMLMRMAMRFVVRMSVIAFRIGHGLLLWVIDP